MSRSLRLGLFATSALGVAALLGWGISGLTPFGDYPGPYGNLVAHLTVPKRHITNAVTAVVFDVRGVDTMFEETLLFVAASGVALMLRETRDYTVADIVDAVRSDALCAAGAVGAVITLLLGLYVVAHGMITPGGGFQGGVVVAAALLMIFLAVEYHGYRRIGGIHVAEPVEALGVAAYVGLGLLAFGFGDAFLQNFIDFGIPGRLRSGGSATLVNWSSAIAVAGGLALVFAEFLQEDMAMRYGRGGPR